MLNASVLLLAAASVAIALVLVPWRVVHGPAWGACLVAVAIALAAQLVPAAGVGGAELRWSGAALLVLMVGWPMAVLVLAGSALLHAAAAGTPPAEAWLALAWHGLLPAAGALAVGWLVRHRLPRHPFVYLLGRAGFGTWAVVFGAGALRLRLGDAPLDELALVAVLLLAFAEAMTTVLVASALFAARRDWLATYRDRVYLAPAS